MKRYIPFLNGTAFMGMFAKRPDGVYGPEYAPDSDVDWVLASDVDALLTQCEMALDMLIYSVHGEFHGVANRDDCGDCKDNLNILAAIRAARGET